MDQEHRWRDDHAEGERESTADTVQMGCNVLLGTGGELGWCLFFSL